jgi:hypothetical protein
MRRALHQPAVADVAEILLAEGPDLQQDDVLVDDVVVLGVVERLVGVLNRFAEDALAALGVVLDLHRQVAADAFDENLVLDRDVRMLAEDVLVAAGARPFEIVLWREGVVALAAVVDVFCA